MSARTPQPVQPGFPTRRTVTSFEYIGATALTVNGPVTGRAYRFEKPGAVLEVDPRDRSRVAAIPLLRARPPD